MSRRAFFPVLLLGVSALWAAGAWAQARPGSVEAITRPSGDVTLKFTRPGRVAQVLVKEGDVVKAGQMLVHLDDEAEKVKLSQLKSKAEDTVRVRAAEAQLAQKEVDLDKYREAYKKKAVSKFDVDHAKLDVDISRLSVELAKFEHRQAQFDYDQARVELDRMRLNSPIDGKVEKLMVHPGESADAQTDVVRVVKIDPLWVDVPMTLAAARALKLDDPGWVFFASNEAVCPPGAASDERKGDWVEGKIIHVAAVADAASATLTVRVEVSNTGGRPAGEHVRVMFCEPKVVDTDRSRDTGIARNTKPERD